MTTGTGSDWIGELASSFELWLSLLTCSSVNSKTPSDAGGWTEDGLLDNSSEESEGEPDSVAETCAAACSAAFLRATFIFLN